MFNTDLLFCICLMPDNLKHRLPVDPYDNP